MEKLLRQIKKRDYPVIAFMLGALAMFLMLTYSQMLTTGKYVVIGGDAWEIYISNIRMLIRTIKDGGNIWYSFATSMGYNTSLTVAFELMSPFNILFFIFDKADPNVILAIIVIGKVGMSAAAFQLFSSKVLGNETVFSVVFSVFYAMCAFTVEYCITNFMWMDGIYMLPVVAWATYVAVKKNKYVFLTLSFAYIFIVQFYMGYLLAGFSTLYFIFLLCVEKKEKRATKPIISIVSYSLSALTAIALSAFLWMPVLKFLINHTVSDSTQFASIFINPMDILNNLFWGEFQDYHSYPYIYCGLPAVLLLPFFFFNRKISLKQKLLYGFLLLFFVLGCMVLPIYKLLHGFDAPDMWNYRFSFIISFLLCVIGCIQCNYISEIKLKWFLLFCIFLIILYCVEQKIQPLHIGTAARNSNNGLVINALFVLLWVVLFVFRMKPNIRKTTVALSLIILSLVEVVTNGCVRTYDPIWKRGLVEENLYYTWEKENRRNIEEIEKENLSETGFYRVCVFDDATYNSDAYFGYNGISDFNSAENENLRNFMRNMGFCTSTRVSSGTGLTPPMEMLLSVKETARVYIATAMLGIEPDVKIYENEFYLPLGFTVNDDVNCKMDYSSNTIENQNILMKALSGVDNVFEEIPMERIYQDSNGLKYFEEDKAFYYTGDEGKETSFLISGVEDPVYILVDSFIDEDNPSGIRYRIIMNKVNTRMDNTLSRPFIARIPQAGDNHKITIEAANSFSGEYEIKDLYFYSLSSEKLREVHDVLSEETMVLDEIKNGKIKGRIKTSGKKTMMFTSIPYTDGWTLMVDGQEQKIEPIINDTFCGIRLPEAGEHEVEMTYHCPGARSGMWVSATGLVMLAILIFLERKRTKVHTTE